VIFLYIFDAHCDYLWIKARDVDSKGVYGCLIVNIDGDGPTVEKIYVSSPESGTYKTGQTVKIRVGFSEPIVGSTVPTLKIKFGDSAVREVSNGTIVNSGNGSYYWQHYIEYSYDIQNSDKGQLATVELTGGNIKDSSDNAAILSCPIITGNTIKANVEGTTTNNTENQDKTNNDGKTDDKKEENKTGEKDTTTANKILPNTGMSKIIISLIVILSVTGICIYIKYKNIKLK